MAPLERGEEGITPGRLDFTYMSCVCVFPCRVYAFQCEHACVDLFQRGEGSAHMVINYSLGGWGEVKVGGDRRGNLCLLCVREAERERGHLRQLVRA